MRKIINYGIFIFLIFIVSTNTVLAQSVKVSCPDKAKPGSSFTCSVVASYDKEYGALEAVPSFSSGLKLGDFTRGSKFSSGDITETKLSVISDDELVGSTDIGKFTVIMDSSVKDSQTIKFTNVKIIDLDYNNVVCSDIIVTVLVDDTKEEENKPNNGGTNTKPSIGNNNNSGGGSSNNKAVSTKITSIKLSSGEIEFNKNINNYEMEVTNDVMDISIEVELEDKSSSVSITGNKGLMVGDNTINIVVTGSDGSTNTYTIQVNRLGLSSDSLLESLKIEGYDIDFNKYKFEYNLELKNNFYSLEIEAIPVSDKATVKIEGNNNLVNAKKINIIVQAEDGSKSIYVLNLVGLASMKLLYGLIGAVLVTIILVVVITILIKRKNRMIKD